MSSARSSLNVTYGLLRTCPALQSRLAAVWKSSVSTVCLRASSIDTITSGTSKTEPSTTHDGCTPTTPGVYPTFGENGSMPPR
jgi:hypothetical protein